MDDQQSRQRARRRFIRAYHPDHGGDPVIFAAGLADLDQDRAGSPPARVTVVPGKPLLTTLLTAAMRWFGWRQPPPRVK
jgi:hypothetical protein